MYKIKTLHASTRDVLDNRVNSFLEELDDEYIFVDLRILLSKESSYYVDNYTATVIMKYVFVRKVLTEKTHV